ncbi:MAG: hypothetical protein PHI27_03425 [Eubacteriales bacterium]|nr:hypothetical protein [Eubacteriales bacterium]MDD3881286.1 hypothetical protein [Eubacteriales bacterium]MDD4512204.1 hypothetical protein [Eubacteriales bacterium]
MMKSGKKSFSWIALIIFIVIAAFIGFTLMFIFSNNFAIRVTAFQKGVSLDSAVHKKLIVVNTSGSAASLTCLEVKNGRYTVAAGMQSIKGFVGKKGVGERKEWADGYTPAGLFPLVSALGSDEKPETGFEYKALDESSTIEISSESNAITDAESAEISVSVYGKQEYELAILINAGKDAPTLLLECVSDEVRNDEALATKNAKSGKDIIEVGTDGNIAVEKADLIRILSWAEPESTYIFIIK